MNSFESLEKAIYQMPQRDAAHMLLNPNLINTAFIVGEVQLTPQRVETIKGLLQAIARDSHHNPTTLRERVMLDITHDLGFLAVHDAIWLNSDPHRIVAYLVNKYPNYVKYFVSITIKEIDRFQKQLIATIEEGMRN